MSDCTVQFYCPPMKIERLPGGLHRTAAEPMVATVRIGPVWSFVELTISPVTIPPTLSRKTGFLEWTVDACVGEGSDNTGELVLCPTCHGSRGWAEWSVAGPFRRNCDHCKGTGYINKAGFSCPRCEGSGKYRRLPLSEETDCAVCKGSGLIDGNRVRVELPEERVQLQFLHKDSGIRYGYHFETLPIEEAPVSIKSLHPGLYALAIDAPVTLWLADGRVFKGSVTFPDCKIDNPLFEPVAEAVTTTGGELVEVTQ